MNRAEQMALKVYPKMSRITEGHGLIPADYQCHNLGDANAEKREGYVNGYKQAEKDTIERACKWLESLVDGDVIVNVKAFVDAFRNEMEEGE